MGLLRDLGVDRGPTPRSVQRVSFKTTAYCSCGYCCGWHHGLALGPLPFYLPLCFGKKRASGNRVFPLIPRRRYESPRKKNNGKGAPLGWSTIDRLRGAAAGSAVGTAVATYMLLKHGGWNKAAAQISTGAELGALVGGLFCPVAPYWAETNLAGYPYEGTTATVAMPREPLGPLFGKIARKDPWSIPRRLLLLQWFARDGTIAADTSVYKFGTRMHIPDWGWGVVEDRGGAIKGEQRIDLYHNNHQHALNWGIRYRDVRVERY